MCHPFVEASAQQTDHKEMDDTLSTAPREHAGQPDTDFTLSTQATEENIHVVEHTTVNMDISSFSFLEH